MKSTNEQLHCIATAKKDKIVVIQASAGVGKTSTLVMIAKEITQSSIYLAFNKIAADEAAAKFPCHVTCKTTHSVAYAKFGGKLKDKLSRPKGSYVNVAGTGGEIARFYKIAPVFSQGEIAVSAAAVGLFVKTAVQKFEQSASTTLEVEHVPTYEIKLLTDKHPFDASVVSNNVLRYARKMWLDRIDLNSPVLATHDTYLKQWQLSNPVLNYDIIYLDEAQDTTLCVLDVVMKQKHAKIVLVGDNRQNIYEWRGSINAMVRIGSDVTQCLLSQSFRYGQAVADVATRVLNNDVMIKGLPSINSVVGDYVVDRTKPYAVLCRTNAYLIDSAIIDLEAGKNVSIEIDVKDFVKVLESAKELFNGNSAGVKHEKVVPYTTWQDFVEEGKSGGEIGRVASIVANNRADRMISILKCYVKPENPHIIYTTAHRCKGREFEQVVLGSDFPSNYDNDGEWCGLAKSEENLLYVAVTRAILRLDINSTVREIYEYYDERLPVHAFVEVKSIEETLNEMIDSDYAIIENNFDFFAVANEYQAKYEKTEIELRNDNITDEEFYANF